METLHHRDAIPHGLTPENFWEQFYADVAEERKRWKEDRKRWKKAEQERAKRQAEDEKKWEKWQKSFAETKRLVKETTKSISDLGNRFGELAEHLVAPGIDERFRELGLDFDITAPNIRIRERGNIIAEIDLLLENAESIMAVEVKSKPDAKDVETHGHRLEKLRGHYAKRGDRRRIMGAMAGAVFGSREKKAAIDAGFYVIVQSGDTMKLEIPEGFVPKEW